jgi:hypothetical protein
MNTNLIECLNCDRRYNTTVNLHCPFCGRPSEKSAKNNTQSPTLAEAIENRRNSDNTSPQTGDN